MSVSATAERGVTEVPSLTSLPCSVWTRLRMMLAFRSAFSVKVSCTRYQRGSVDRSAM
ncbi:hypothetical protein D3C71_1660560 [compost metagenome]